MKANSNISERPVESSLDRELRALEAAAALLPNARMCLLTLTRAGLPGRLPNDVVAEPAYHWLLRAPTIE